jgi:antagonist of KipI
LKEVFLVLKAGLFTTVQDLGRNGYLRHGVPISGAMDQFSLNAANVLVGNKSHEACLETTIAGPELQALMETQIALAGARCSPKINGEDVPMWRTLAVKTGDVVSLENAQDGCRAYLSVRGGINVPLVLGSRSTYVRGAFGGLDGRALRNGDLIETANAVPPSVECYMPEELVPQFTESVEAHVVLGPQADRFTEAGIAAFLSSVFKVSSEADRMGYRLEGPRVEHVREADIVSDALLPGAIQVPRDGRPIIVMRDAQTTGGYAKIAVVITPDLSVLGQAKPGRLVRFARVSQTEAQERSREFFKLLKGLSNTLVKNE